MALPAPDVATLGASTSSAPKNTVAELKNGKVVFKQKPVSFEKASETMQDIVKFREMLESRVKNQDSPLASIPDEHKPLIVKLSQESDKGLVPLAKQIRSILLPGPGEVEGAHRLSLESSLPLAAVELAIKTVMSRVNYGLDGPLGHKPPAAVCIWRWEVQDTYRDWLPKSARDSADARLAERAQASADLRAAFKSLSQAEQDAILDPKGALKIPTSDTNKSEVCVATATTNEKSSEDHIPKDARSDLGESEAVSGNLTSMGRTKKDPDPEKAAKMKDKEEKRAAKVEKEKKQKEAQDRSRSIMASFFGKVKPSTQDQFIKDANASASSLTDNEFQRTFRPFILKKDAEIAPYNWFLDGKRGPHNRRTGVSRAEVIVIDDDLSAQGILEPETSPSEVALSTVPSDLSTILRELFQEYRQSSPKQRVQIGPFRTYNPVSVRDVVSQLNDAEIAGDPTQVRHLLSILRDRQVFPAKVFIFHEDSRPGYYGTWTRNSREVGPCKPLERDVLARDYGYDSGEDWEDEGPDDADDVVDDGEDDEPEAEDADSDLDSWLVDDDEPPLDLDNLSSPHLDLTIPPSKRKAENTEKRPDKKRKVVIPLVPHVKGPFWESCIGQCEYDPFNSYRVQFLNDTPLPINPFTFVSTFSEEGRSSLVDSTFSSRTLSSGVQRSVGKVASSLPKRTMSSALKAPFPEAHMGTLLAKITNLAAPSLTYLVESIYQDLRIHKIKKNVIEAKVREISEKSKEKKVWVVKQAVQIGSAMSRDGDGTNHVL